MSGNVKGRKHRTFSQAEKLKMGKDAVEGVHGSVKQAEAFFGVASSQLLRYRKMYEASQRVKPNGQAVAVQQHPKPAQTLTPVNAGQVLLLQQQNTVLQEELALRTHERDVLQKILMAVGESL
jgi:transposase-like protein